MEVVGKQPSLSQTSAWATPLTFNRDSDRPSSSTAAQSSQTQSEPHLQSQSQVQSQQQIQLNQSKSHLSHQQRLQQQQRKQQSLHQQPSLQPTPSSFSSNSSSQASLQLSRQAPVSNSIAQNVQVSDRLTPQHLQSHHHSQSDYSQGDEVNNPTYALVRSESAPLNVWGDHLSSRVADLSVDDTFPTRNVTFAPVSHNDHFSSSRNDQNIPESNTFNSFASHTITDSSSVYNRRPPHPTRSRSSTELAAAVNLGRTSNVTTGPVSSQPVGSGHLSQTSMQASKASTSRGANVQSWHKSVFDMIQDDFPRTPSTLFSSLLPTLPTSSSSANPPTITTNSECPRPNSADRRSRLASTASLDLDLDRLRAVSDPPTDVSSSALTSEEVARPNQAMRPSHRRSVSMNWSGELRSFSPNISKSSSKTNLAASPSNAAIFSNNLTDMSNGPSGSTAQINPSPGSTLEQLKGSSPPRPISPADHVGRGPRGSSPQSSGQPSRLSHGTSATSMPSSIHVPSYSQRAAPSESVISNSIEDLMSPSLPDYDYLYDQPDSAIPTPGVHGASPFPSQQFTGTQPHLGAASSVMNSHPQHIANGSYANIFPGMGLFPSPFSNNPGGVANGVAPIYTDSFRDGLAAADSLKSMSIQMAAFLSAQQQLYAAQVAQMAAIAGSSAFSNSAPLSGGLHGSGLNHLSNSSHGLQARSPWEGRDVNNSHRNVSRPRHHFDQYRNNFGQVNSKKLASMDMGHKNRNVRNRRSHRGGHDDMSVMNSHKGLERSAIPGGALGGCLHDSGQARSPLLEEFRATSLSIGRGIGSGEIGIGGGYGGGGITHTHNGREWQLSEIKNHVVEFATDQHGSRFIQQKLELASDEDKEAVLNQVLTDAQRLMTDVFGNYVVQKLLDHGGQKAVKLIAGELEGRMLSLSLHMYGCRVVQKALEVLHASYRSSLVKELDGHVLKCIRDQNGNHVIQKCVELVEAESVQFIVNAVQGQAVHLAGHSYGCRVVQRILEHGASEQKAPIMMEIMSSISDLIKDQYGNYVIQHVVEHGTEEERGIIMELVRGQVCQLSQHKFASNVVERCLQFGSLDERRVLIEILIGSDGGSNPSPLNQLVRDQFGNYVVQRVLDVALPPQRERVVNILKAQVPAIKKYSYGKHIIARLEEHHHHHHHHHRSHGHGTHASGSGLSRVDRGSGSTGGSGNISGSGGGLSMSSMVPGGANIGHGTNYMFYN